MLLWNLDLLFDDPFLFFLMMVSVTIALLFALTFHEFGHAYMANRLGDPTPKRLGRLSLNPLRHLDRMGTLMIYLVGFGWAKPVPVGFGYLRGNQKRSMGIVALAGPLSNLALAAVFGILVRTGVVDWIFQVNMAPRELDAELMISLVVAYVVVLNLILAVFNLIPIAPLDGFKVAVGLLPDRQAYALARWERYGPMVLLGFIILGYATGFLSDFLGWILDGLTAVFVGGGA
jgi:Zn-dependent protease